MEGLYGEGQSGQSIPGSQEASQCLSSVTGDKRPGLLVCFVHLPLRGVVTLETAVSRAPSFPVSTLFWVLLSAAWKSLRSVVRFPELRPTPVKAMVQEFRVLKVVTRIQSGSAQNCATAHHTSLLNGDSWEQLDWACAPGFLVENNRN